MSTTEAPIEKLKQSQRAAWMAGDFGVVARTINAGAEQFVASLPIEPGMVLLDVATGTGNLALPAARRGAVVTGVDIATNLLEQGRQRAAAEGLSITFDEGDAEQLPYADATFDMVITMFGAMFAPRPEVVASELARVLKPGGWLAMGNWTPAGFSGRMFRVASDHVPSPVKVPPPVLWGDDATVRQRLAPYFTDIETVVTPISFDLPMNPAGTVSFFRTYFGPTQMAFNRLDEKGQAAFAAALEALWAESNTAPDPQTHTLVPNEFLRVTAKRTS